MPRCCLHWGWLCLERAWRWVLSHSGVPGSRVLQAVWLSEGPAPHLPVLHCIPWLEFSTRVTVCRLYTKLLAQDKSQKGECSEVLVGRGWFAECESRVPAHPGATSPVASVSGPVGLGPYPAPPTSRHSGTSQHHVWGEAVSRNFIAKSRRAVYLLSILNN